MTNTTCKIPRDSVGWRCGSCGQLITSIDEGWVEWVALDDGCGASVLRGMRLVHSGVVRGSASDYGCRYDYRKEFHDHAGIVEGLALERFAGPDGLMLLFSFIATGEFSTTDILELAKRVQVPRYELSRELFPQAIACQAFAPFLGKGYYLQSEMKELLTWATGAPKHQSGPVSGAEDATAIEAQAERVAQHNQTRGG